MTYLKPSTSHQYTPIMIVTHLHHHTSVHTGLPSRCSIPEENFDCKIYKSTFLDHVGPDTVEYFLNMEAFFWTD